MKFFADFNLHSKYSRGTHPDMEIPTLAKTAKTKGLALLGTGDFTQPQWLVELKKFLKPSSGRGVFEYDDVDFILTTELVCVYSRNGRTFKINHLVFAPHFSAADKVVDALERHGNLETEARPSVKLSAEDLVKAVMDVSAECLVVPAHAWGLHHSLFSPQFGYDSLAEAYGAQAENIRVLETGLCCDPGMARRWAQTRGKALMSNSDAHHPDQLGREANIFDCALDYREILSALTKNDPSKFLGTVEMFPEEDRHHLPGHKNCAARAKNALDAGPCPACGESFSPSVSARVEALADVSSDEARSAAPPFHRLISLRDVIADALGFQPDADSVKAHYQEITLEKGAELDILLLWPEEKLRRELQPRVAEGVLALRREDVLRDPGYDGAAGRVRVNLPSLAPRETGQLKLF